MWVRGSGAVPRPAGPRLAAAVLGLALAAVLAGCGSAAGAFPLSGPPSGTSALTSTRSSQADGATASPASSHPSAHLSPPVAAGLRWVGYATPAGGAPYVYVAQTDGGRVGLLWMDSSRLRFRYVPGYHVPEAGPTNAADTQPATWVPRMVAAFNGGFRLADAVGGYFYAGRLVRHMVAGNAAFAISSDGRVRVGVWGQDLSLTPGTVVIRQNLPPLISDYRSHASASDSPDAWGQANGGLAHANRSALGQLADGALVFAYGSELAAVDVAAALTAVHVRTAVMLDMNKSWPSAFVYRHVGGHVVGQRILPSIWRDPTIYLRQFSKDFVVAMAP